MPLKIPNLDDRRYQELLDEALARIKVHNPEWTNFNRSDPGVTIIEVFAFLTETLLYRANQIPERNRKKFLSLLGIPLAEAAPARGIVTFSNERGPLRTVTLTKGVELRAGEQPFRTESGLDVLPVEAQVYYKQTIDNPSDRLLKHYKYLYATQLGKAPKAKKIRLYRATPLDPQVGLDLSAGAADGALWIALLARSGDKPYSEAITLARRELSGKVLNLGIVPLLKDSRKRIVPAGSANAESAPLIRIEMPNATQAAAQYRAVPWSASLDVLARSGVVQLVLPDETGFETWTGFDPLEAGVGEYPPELEDSRLNERIITWLRLSPEAGVEARILWAGINAVMVTQRERVVNESLPNGTSQPDQTATLSKTPVLPGSVTLRVTVNGNTATWKEIDDLTAAGPEVVAPDLRQPPGMPEKVNPLVEVFALNPESGEIRFGDGARGKRPPLDAVMRADYDSSSGDAGNVRESAINTGTSLPAGMKVTNPVRTWGGAAGETVALGEKQITRYLQHRDRLVTAADFETLAWRAPGVEVGRVEVIPAYRADPQLKKNEPGDAAGVVTLMVIPKSDATQPDAPLPDRHFLDAMCRHLEPRRLVTTELLLEPPDYVPVWVSVGLSVVAGASMAEVREAVRKALLAFLSPLPASDFDPFSSEVSEKRGWPLRKPVSAPELMAVASRVSGVMAVNKVLLARDSQDATTEPVPMLGLNLPRVMGISVTAGDPTPIGDLRGRAPEAPSKTEAFMPVPVVPEVCR